MYPSFSGKAEGGGVVKARSMPSEDGGLRYYRKHLTSHATYRQTIYLSVDCEQIEHWTYCGSISLAPQHVVVYSFKSRLDV